MIRRALPVVLLILCLSGGGVQEARAESEKSKSDSLRAVTLLFRHSIVSPKYVAPKLKVEWSKGLRHLTALGIREMYDTGQTLRQRYVEERGLISGVNIPSEIYVRTSNTDRALESAQMLMLGLFPLGTGPDPAIYDESLKAAPAPGMAFNPVPIHSVALKNDNVLRPYTGKAKCQRYRTFVKQLPKTELYRKQGAKYRDLLRRASTATGMYEGKSDSKLLYAINEINEVLSANIQHKLPLPDGLSPEDLQTISDLSDWNYHHQFLGREVGSLMGGPFLDEALANFIAVAKADPSGRKFSLYAGHQRTVLGVEAALGIETSRTEGPLFRGRIPPPATHYAFELHELAKGRFGVRLVFSSKAGEKVIEIPGCGGAMCPFDHFAKRVVEIMPKDWSKACRI